MGPDGIIYSGKKLGWFSVLAQLKFMAIFLFCNFPEETGLEIVYIWIFQESLYIIVHQQLIDGTWKVN